MTYNVFGLWWDVKPNSATTTHCQSTSGPFSHTLPSVVILKLTYSLIDLTVLTFILLVFTIYFYAPIILIRHTL